MMVVEDPETFNTISNAQLGVANAWMGSCFTGCALAALEEALEYAKIRVQGGKAISTHQSVQSQLFDMFTSVEAARAFSRRVWIYNHVLFKKQQPLPVHYSMASKILATGTAFRVAAKAIQIFGGNGLSKEYYIEKVFRDARAALIEDGVNETLALGGAERLLRGPGKWVVTGEI